MLTHNEIVEGLYKMDWSVVDFKMQSVDLNGNSVEDVKKECFRFLALYALNTGHICPSQTVDKYWHMMIIDTQNYEAAGKNVFGRFLHHVPNGNLPGDAALNEKNFWHTIDEYEAIWGPPNFDVWGIEAK